MGYETKTGIRGIQIMPKVIKSRRELQETAVALVVTIPEIEKIWKVSRKSIEMQVAKGRLVTRQTLGGKIILVSTDSVVELWGKPDADNALKVLLAPELK